MLHLIDICFLTCICLLQISKIQTCLCVVVGPGLVSTSPDFMRSISSHPAGPHGRLAQKTVIGPPFAVREGSTQFAQGMPDRCDSSHACRLCHLEPCISWSSNRSSAFNLHTFSNPVFIYFPHHTSIPILMTVVIGSTPFRFLKSSLVFLSFMEMPHIHQIICISAL